MATHVNIGGNSNTTILSMGSDDSTLHVTDIYESGPPNGQIVNNSLEQDLANLTKIVTDNTATIDSTYLEEKVGNLFDKKLNTNTKESTPMIGICGSFAGKKYYKHAGFAVGNPGIYPNLNQEKPYTKNSIINMASESRYWPNAAAMILEHEGYMNSQDNLSKHLVELKVPEGERGYGVVRFYQALAAGTSEPAGFTVTTISPAMYLGQQNASTLPYSKEDELYKLANLNIASLLSGLGMPSSSPTASEEKDVYFRIVPANREPTIADAFTHQLACYLPRIDSIGATNLPLGPDVPSINGGDSYRAPNPFAFPDRWADGNPFNDFPPASLLPDEATVPYFGIYAQVIIALLANPILFLSVMKDINRINNAVNIVNQLAQTRLLWQQPGTMWNYTGSPEIPLLAVQRIYNSVNGTQYDAQKVLEEVLFKKIGMSNTYMYFTRSQFESLKNNMFPPTISNLSETQITQFETVLGVTLPRPLPWVGRSEVTALTVEEMIGNTWVYDPFKSYAFVIEDEYMETNKGEEQRFFGDVVGWWSTDVDRLNYYTFLINGNDINGKQIVSREILYKYTRSVNNGYSPEEYRDWGYYPLSFFAPEYSESTFTGRAFRDGTGRVVSINNTDTPAIFNNSNPNFFGALPNGADSFWGGANGTLFHLDFADNTVYLLSICQGVGGNAKVPENYLESNIEQESTVLVLFWYGKRYLQNSLIIPSALQIGSNQNLELAELVTTVSRSLYSLSKRIENLENA